MLLDKNGLLQLVTQLMACISASMLKIARGHRAIITWCNDVSYTIDECGLPYHYISAYMACNRPYNSKCIS